jgi:hypothetical protein
LAKKIPIFVAILSKLSLIKHNKKKSKISLLFVTPLWKWPHPGSVDLITTKQFDEFWCTIMVNTEDWWFWLYYYDDNFGEVWWFFGLKFFNIFYSSNSSFLKTWKFEAAQYLEINANDFFIIYQCVQDFYNFYIWDDILSNF